MNYDTVGKKIVQGVFRQKYPQSLGLFHSYTKIRMEIALNAFECMRKYLPPNKMQEFPFRCGWHSFLTHVKSAIDSLTEEINLLYGIDPSLAAKGRTMSIERLTRKCNGLRQSNQNLYTEIGNVRKAAWFEKLKASRNEEAVHGAISGKTWQIALGTLPKMSVGMKEQNIADLATWCPETLEEVNKFLERCYRLMAEQIS